MRLYDQCHTTLAHEVRAEVRHCMAEPYRSSSLGHTKGAKLPLATARALRKESKLSFLIAISCQTLSCSCDSRSQDLSNKRAFPTSFEEKSRVPAASSFAMRSNLLQAPCVFPKAHTIRGRKYIQKNFAVKHLIWIVRIRAIPSSKERISTGTKSGAPHAFASLLNIRRAAAWTLPL